MLFIDKVSYDLYRMGKTIQMIALLVSDKGAKPNLVVA